MASAKQIAATKRWHKEHPGYNRVSTKARATQRRDAIWAIKATRGCLLCEEGSIFKHDPKVLDFHHRNPAEKGFSIGKKTHGKPMDVILEEIDKCDVLCANHHRLVEAKKREEDHAKCIPA